MIEKERFSEVTRFRDANEVSMSAQSHDHAIISEGSKCLIADALAQVELLPSSTPLLVLTVGFENMQFTQLIKELGEESWTYEDCKESAVAEAIICSQRIGALFVSVEGLDIYAPNWISKIQRVTQGLHKPEIIAICKKLFPGLKDQLIRSGASAVILQPAN